MKHYLPLERIEERYTPMMNDCLNPFFDFIYYPEMDTTTIDKGEFLDVEKTIEFKAKQLALVAQSFQQGNVKDGDVFFVADIFYPGIESIRYMSELQGLDVSIVGYNHAGRSDKHDFVQNLGTWSDTGELTYLSICDIILCGSEYHRNLICSYFNINPSKVMVTGCVWDKDYAFNLYPVLNEKKDQVVFPHRLSDEKGLDEFLDIVNQTPDVKYVITSSNKNKRDIDLPPNVEYRYGLSKKEYYQTLSESKYYLSCAYQETFGYTLREALLYGCIPVVPDRANYPETVPSSNRYETVQDAVKKLRNATTIDQGYVDMFHKNAEKINEILCKIENTGTVKK